MITEMSVSRCLMAKSFRSLFFLSVMHRLRILVEEMEKLLSVFLCSVFICSQLLVSAAELNIQARPYNVGAGDREDLDIMLVVPSIPVP